MNNNITINIYVNNLSLYVCNKYVKYIKKNPMIEPICALYTVIFLLIILDTTSQSMTSKTRNAFVTKVKRLSYLKIHIHITEIMINLGKYLRLGFLGIVSLSSFLDIYNNYKYYSFTYILL